MPRPVRPLLPAHRAADTRRNRFVPLSRTRPGQFSRSQWKRRDISPRCSLALMPSASKLLKCAALTFDHAGRRLVATSGVPTKAARIHPWGFFSPYHLTFRRRTWARKLRKSLLKFSNKRA
jgi:hypothetical protein